MHAILMCYNEIAYVKNIVSQLVGIVDRITIQDNGSTDGTLEWLATQDYLTTVFARQSAPPDFSALTNNLLSYIPNGEIVIRLAPDEYLSDALANSIRAGKYSDGASYELGLYHLMNTTRQCMPIEYPVYHYRIFRASDGVRYGGNVHEQANYPSPRRRVLVDNGEAIIHFSYLNRPVLRQKARRYETIPGSGFHSGNRLDARLELQTKPLPANITYAVENTFAADISRRE